jgi:hypothetical protein
MKILLCLFVSAFLIGCQTQAQNTSEISQNNKEIKTSSSETTDKEISIRKVDFRNFTYPWTEKIDSGEKFFNLQNGEKIVADAPNLSIKSIYYGDIVNDFEGDEAIITINIEDGNATSEILFVYAIETSETKLLQSFEFFAGDNVSLGTAFVAHGELVIETYNQLSTDAECCPSIVEIAYYKWQNNKFVIQGEPQKIQNGYAERLKSKRK